MMIPKTRSTKILMDAMNEPLNDFFDYEPTLEQKLEVSWKKMLGVRFRIPFLMECWIVLWNASLPADSILDFFSGIAMRFEYLKTSIVPLFHCSILTCTVAWYVLEVQYDTLAVDYERVSLYSQCGYIMMDAALRRLLYQHCYMMSLLLLVRVHVLAMNAKMLITAFIAIPWLLGRAVNLIDEEGQ